MLTFISTTVKALITDIPKFNRLESTRRRRRVQDKITCRDFSKRNEANFQKQRLQSKAFMKDEEEIKLFMRQLKMKYRKDVKLLKSGVATM